MEEPIRQRGQRCGSIIVDEAEEKRQQEKQYKKQQVDDAERQERELAKRQFELEQRSRAASRFSDDASGSASGSPATRTASDAGDDEGDEWGAVRGGADERLLRSIWDHLLSPPEAPEALEHVCELTDDGNTDDGGKGTEHHWLNDVGGNPAHSLPPFFECPSPKWKSVGFQGKVSCVLYIFLLLLKYVSCVIT